MNGFFRGDDLERKLRAGKPWPSDDLVQRIEADVRANRSASRRRFRVALPAVFTAVILGCLAAVGGVSYAASGVVHAAKSVSHVFKPASAHHVVAVKHLSSGGDQYTPGYGWGDPAHNTGGAPVISVGGKAPGAFLPPLTPKVKGPTALVSASININSQAHLYISVIDRKTGTKYLITQTKSTVDSNALTGPQAKTVNYMVLIPRVIPLTLAIPAHLLTSGSLYQIQIIAQAPNGQKSTTKIPFTAPSA